MIIASASGRCSLVGGQTDFVGGSVLSCSLRERATCTLESGASEFVISVSGRTQVPAAAEDLGLVEDDPLNILRAVLAALEIAPGKCAPIHLKAETEIPSGAGLAASAAMLAAATGCLLAHLGLRLNPYEIAELIRKIDSDYLNHACGFEAHYMAVFGGINFLDFRDRRRDAAQTPATPFASVEPLERYVPEVPLIVAHWSSVRLLDAVIPSRQGALGTMARGAKRALLARDWDSLGALMNRCHKVQQTFTQNDQIDGFAAAALAGGALGAVGADGVGAATVTALTLDPARTAAALTDAGADVILYPHPSPGLTVCHEVTV